MKHICPVCGYKAEPKNAVFNSCGQVCWSCGRYMSQTDWQRAIVKARKLGIIKEPVNWAKLAEK